MGLKAGVTNLGNFCHILSALGWFPVPVMADVFFSYER